MVAPLIHGKPLKETLYETQGKSHEELFSFMEAISGKTVKETAVGTLADSPLGEIPGVIPRVFQVCIL